MFDLESLHPDGWRHQGFYKLECWAYREAKARCCRDGRNYRILHGPTQRMIALVTSSSCRPPTQALAPAESAADRACSQR